MDTKQEYQGIEPIYECRYCGYLNTERTDNCIDCDKSLIYVVPKEFEGYSFEKMYNFITVYFSEFEDFIHKNNSSIRYFDFNGAFTKLLEEVENDKERDNINTVYHHCNHLQDYLYEGNLDLEFLKGNKYFEKTLESICEITQRYNCLRALLYSNDEDIINYNDFSQNKYKFRSFEETQKQEVENEHIIDSSRGNFKTKLNEYSFFELPKIKELSPQSIDILIAKIHSAKIWIQIAWFYHLDFIENFIPMFSKNKTDRNKKLSVLLNSNSREVGGHINSFTTGSKDRDRYKAHTFLKQITEEYKILKN